MSFVTDVVSARRHAIAVRLVNQSQRCASFRVSETSTPALTFRIRRSIDEPHLLPESVYIVHTCICLFARVYRMNIDLLQFQLAASAVSVDL